MNFFDQIAIYRSRAAEHLLRRAFPEEIVIVEQQSHIYKTQQRGQGGIKGGEGESFRANEQEWNRGVKSHQDHGGPSGDKGIDCVQVSCVWLRVSVKGR